MSSALVSALRNLRSPLVKNATLLLSQIAHRLADRFDVMGEVIIPLSFQTSHGIQIIGDSCKYSILEIVIHYQTKGIMKSVCELGNSRSSRWTSLSSSGGSHSSTRTSTTSQRCFRN
jgi:hypothetical protein